MEPSNSLSNTEALLNICANATEIVCIVGAVPCLLFCCVPLIFKVRGYTLKMLGLSIFSAIYGLASPGLINWITASAIDANVLGLGVVLSIVIALIGLSIGLTAWLVPTILAVKEKVPNKVWIIVLNLCMLPFSWLIAFIWVCRMIGIKRAS